MTGFFLVNASIAGNVEDPLVYADSFLQEIRNDDVISVSDLQEEYGSETEFSIVCTTSPAEFATTPFQIGSVGIRDNFASGTEFGFGNQIFTANDPTDEGYYFDKRFPPYSLGGDQDGSYAAIPFEQRTENWEVTCQAFCDPDLGWDGTQPSDGIPNPEAYESLSSPETTIQFTVIS